MTATAIGVPVATAWTGPDAPRPEDEPAIADVPDVAAWAFGLDTAARLGLHGRTLTQALLGEPVEVVTERGDWVEVALPDQPASGAGGGYPGWIRRSHLAPAAEPDEEHVVVVTAPVAMVVGDGAWTGLSFGTRLPVVDANRNRVVVALPGAGTATVGAAEVAPYSPAMSSEGAELLRSAALFLRLRYLWGGTSAWGLDCSGLVHLVHRAHGHRVPRDARDQHVSATPVPVDQAGPGDLYFFARPGEPVYHVGFVTNSPGRHPRTMLHAPEGGELVEDAALAPHRLTTLVGAGSYLREPR